MASGKLKLLSILSAILILAAGATAFSLSFMGQRGTAAVIQLSGTITPSSSGFSSNSITPEKVRTLDRRAQQRGVDAIVYEINSGGGAVVASKEIMREIDSVDVPTVCRFRDVGASGAYLAALGCDSIVADPASLTGSIGVRSSYMEYSGLLNKLGIEHVNITSGRYKDMGSPYRNITDEERKKLQEKADTVHEQFAGKVQAERNLTSEQLEEVRTGEAFLGERAKQLGLVDRLGGREEAYSTAERLSGRNLSFRSVESPENLNLFSFLGLPLASTPESAFRYSLSP